MSVNFSQKMIIGTKIYHDELKVVTEKAQYEDQNRYDTRTGKIIKTVSVLIKDEEYHYEFLNKKYDDIFDIDHDFPELNLYYFDEYIILGWEILKPKDLGRVDLIQGKISLEEFTEAFKKVKDILPTSEIECYLDYNIG